MRGRVGVIGFRKALERSGLKISSTDGPAIPFGAAAHALRICDTFMIPVCSRSA
jgi:hypothetical protein